MKKIKLLGIVFLTFSLSIICLDRLKAQDTILIDIEGTIVDEMGEATIGANVLIIGTTIGVASDKDGFFSIKTTTTTELGDSIKISFTGYKTQTKKIKLNKRNRFNIKMERDTLMLDPVPIEYDKKSEVNTLKKIFDLIDENYHNEPLYLNCYVNSMLKHQPMDTLVSHKEAIVQLYYDGYSNTEIDNTIFKKQKYPESKKNIDVIELFSIYDFATDPTDQARLIALDIKKESTGIFRLQPILVGEPLNITASDKVRYPKNVINTINSKNPLDSHDFNHYKYEWEYDSDSTSIIKFSPKKKVNVEVPFEGEITIHDESFAITRIYINDIAHERKRFPNYSLEVNYQLNPISLKWYLKSIKRNITNIVNVHGEGEVVDVFDSVQEIKVLSIQENHVEGFKEREKLHNSFNQYLIQPKAIVPSNGKKILDLYSEYTQGLISYNLFLDKLDEVILELDNY